MKMSFFNKIKQAISDKFFLSLATASVVLAVPAVTFAAWGPERPTYDFNKKPLNGKTCTAEDDAQHNVCGSLTGPVFNSFSNAPTYGDERDFVQLSPAGKLTYSNSITANVGDEIDMRIYVHNNANSGTNGANFDGVGVATNTKVRAYLPTGMGDGFDVAGYVSADNSKPGRVYDTARIMSATGQKIGLLFESATMTNNGPYSTGVNLPAEVAGENGTKIGYNALDGKVPGCFEYRALVTVRFKVTGLKFTKQVTTPGSTNWGKTLNVKQGDTVSWLLTYQNIAGSRLDNITVRDAIPNGLDLVPGSITWVDQFHPTGEVEADTVLGSGGMNVGSANANGGGYIRFRTTVRKNTNICSITNTAYAHTTQTPDQSDSASVTVTDCTPPVGPIYTCDALDLSATAIKVNDSVTATVRYTATNGATFKNATFDFGDGSATVVVTDAARVSASHKYTTTGTKTITVKGMTFTVNGVDTPIVPGAACAKTVSVTTTPPPTVIPNTGAGNMLGIFAGVSAISAAAHNVLSRRRASR